MNTDKIQRLERNEKFRRKFYAKGVWRNYAIVPPSGILFVALFGFLYLFNVDHLMSLYAIPFIILLLLGTIWLKATRKYIINQKISGKQPFAICLSIPLMKKNGKTIMMFSAGSNRLNKYYLEKEKKEILDRIGSDADFVGVNPLNKLLVAVPETDIYLIYPSFSDRLSNKTTTSTVNRYVIFDNLEKIRYITLREMESFS
ncbi:hypothetical protein G7051_03535 [Dysgonomonas sp. HDW5B]|uniref:hypothetical protein n=1 Tax=Dysgonomonas sp. HDW5B TaxID=2714927 RepID=UPI00140CA687|nr:hypothetical protein [Dysgonomonas sp. HDW5B]QIK53469.1 hypothetical protein G7051_03535 [Dysgonomonas sp. HDW5B]